MHETCNPWTLTEAAASVLEEPFRCFGLVRPEPCFRRGRHAGAIERAMRARRKPVRWLPRRLKQRLCVVRGLATNFPLNSRKSQGQPTEVAQLWLQCRDTLIDAPERDPPVGRLCDHFQAGPHDCHRQVGVAFLPVHHGVVAARHAGARVPSRLGATLGRCDKAMRTSQERASAAPCCRSMRCRVRAVATFDVRLPGALRPARHVQASWRPTSVRSVSVTVSIDTPYRSATSPSLAYAVASGPRSSLSASVRG